MLWRSYGCISVVWLSCFFFQAEDGIRDLVRSRGLGDVYKRQSRFLVGPRLRWQFGPPFAYRQSVASGDRRSGGAGQGARQAGPAWRQDPHNRDAAPHPWRCRLCRPRRGGGMLRAFGPQGTPLRRFAALHRQQPDRFHHLAAVVALVALSFRHRQDAGQRGAQVMAHGREKLILHQQRLDQSSIPCRQLRRTLGHLLLQCAV